MNHRTNPTRVTRALANTATATGHTAAAHSADDELLTITETAALLRVPVATLRYWRHRKTGPVSFRVGRGVRYWRAEVIGWLEELSANERSAM